MAMYDDKFFREHVIRVQRIGTNKHRMYAERER